MSLTPSSLPPAVRNKFAFLGINLNPAAPFSWKAKNPLTDWLTSKQSSYSCLVKITSCLLLGFHPQFLPWSLMIHLLPHSSQALPSSSPQKLTGLHPALGNEYLMLVGELFQTGRAVGCPGAGRQQESCQKGLLGLFSVTTPCTTVPRKQRWQLYTLRCCTVWWCEG